jgi:3-hydroxyacyl-CoA dehydrogenase
MTVSIRHEGEIAVVTGDLCAEAVAFARTALTQPLPQPISARPVTAPDAAWWGDQSKVIAKPRQRRSRPLRALDCLRLAAEKPFAEAMAHERATFLELRASDLADALRHIFFAERGAPKPAHLGDAKPKDIRSAAVIGGGTMGIAAALRDAGLPVSLIERDDEAVQRGLANLRSIFDGAVKRGKLTKSQAQARMDGVTAGSDYALLPTLT